MSNSKQKSTQPSAPKRKIPVLWIVFVGVAILLIGTVALSGGGTSEAGEQTGAPVISGEPLPQFPDSAINDPALGLTAPEVVGSDFNDEPVAIQHDGTPTAVVFLAHWCSHCQAEVRGVVPWLEETGGVEGVDLISVATAIDSRSSNYPPSSWLEREDWPVPVIRDDVNSSVLSAYGSGGFPYWVFLDGQGQVVRRTAGELPIEVLEAYLAEIAAT